MRNNTNLVDEILSSIDMMDSITMESSLDVMGSLLDSYDKILTIQENYEGDVDDLETIMESFYQEGEIMDEVKEKNKDRNIFMKILMFIPTLLQAIWHSIKKAWDGGKAAETASSAADKVKDMASDAKNFLSKLISVDEDNKGKIIGLTIAGVTITAAGVASFIAKKTGILDNLLTTVKQFTNEKVLKFFAKALTAEDIPSDVKDVALTSPSPDQWQTFLNIDGVIKFFTEPKDVIEKIGQMTNLSDEKQITKVYEDYEAKITDVRKIKLISKKKFTYTTDQLQKFFSDSQVAISNLGSKANEAYENIKKLVNENVNKAKEAKTLKTKDETVVNDSAIKKLNGIMSTLNEYAGIIPPLVKLVNAFSASYTAQINLAEDALKVAQNGSGTADANATEGESASTDSGEAESSTPEETSATEGNTESAASEQPAEEKSVEDGTTEEPIKEEGSTDKGKTEPKSDESKIEEAKAEYKKRVEEYKEKNGGKISNNKAKGIASKVAAAYGIKNRKIVSEAFGIDLDDDDDVITESVSNGWYSR